MAPTSEDKIDLLLCVFNIYDGRCLKQEFIFSTVCLRELILLSVGFTAALSARAVDAV